MGYNLHMVPWHDIVYTARTSVRYLHPNTAIEFCFDLIKVLKTILLI